MGRRSPGLERRRSWCAQGRASIGSVQQTKLQSFAWGVASMGFALASHGEFRIAMTQPGLDNPPAPSRNPGRRSVSTTTAAQNRSVISARTRLLWACRGSIGA